MSSLHVPEKMQSSISTMVYKAAVLLRAITPLTLLYMFPILLHYHKFSSVCWYFDVVPITICSGFKLTLAKTISYIIMLFIECWILFLLFCSPPSMHTLISLQTNLIANPNISGQTPCLLLVDVISPLLAFYLLMLLLSPSLTVNWVGRETLCLIETPTSYCIGPTSYASNFSNASLSYVTFIEHRVKARIIE